MKIIHRRFLPLTLATLAIAGASASCRGAEPNVVGDWKLVSYYSQELATGNRTNPLGEHPKGYLIYTPQGGMITPLTQKVTSPSIG